MGTINRSGPAGFSLELEKLIFHTGKTDKTYWFYMLTNQQVSCTILDIDKSTSIRSERNFV